MPAHRVKLIVNPNADLGRAWHGAADLRPIVDEYGGADWSGTVYPTHAIELARQAAEQGYELVIAAGGDGTVHEVANGLMQVPREQRPRMGIVPLGSGNDFCHAIGYPSDPAAALRRVFSGQSKHADVGLMHDSLQRSEYFTNAVGIGFDTTVTIRSRRFRFLSGFVVYFLAVLQTIILNHDAPLMQVETDTEQWEQAMLLFAVMNGSREGGGFRVAPDAKPDDGIFHYAGISRVSRPMMFRLLPEVMRGTHGRFSQVRMGTLHRMTLKADRPLYIHADGEILSGFGTDVRQLDVQILPGELEVIV